MKKIFSRPTIKVCLMPAGQDIISTSGSISTGSNYSSGEYEGRARGGIFDDED